MQQIDRIDKRRHVLWLQWLLVIAVAYLLDSNDPQPRYIFTTIDAIILLSIAANLPLFFIPRRIFEETALDYLLVFCDILFVSLAIYFTGQATSEFYLFFFVILIMAATGQNLKALILGVLTISGLYTWLVYTTGQFSLTSGFLLRIPFLFVVGLFFGYLVHLQKLKEERLQAESEFTVDLFEFGKALAKANDTEILHARIPRLIKAIMSADACELIIVEDERIVQRVFQNQYDREFPYLEIHNSIHEAAFETDELYSCGDIQAEAKFAEQEDFTLYPYASYMAKSWKVHARVSGVLAVFRENKCSWTDHDAKKFQFLGEQSVLALQHARLLQELESQARTDGLTGLANHRHFHERMEEELSRARRKHYALSLLMLDMDRFKQINDSYGHRAGDEILRRVATLLKVTTRRMDIPARYGGDEFAVILPETNAEQAQILYNRILNEFRNMKFDEAPEASLSIGSASFPEDGQTVSRLIETADQALYRAKAEGRARAYRYSSLPATRAEAK